MSSGTVGRILQVGSIVAGFFTGGATWLIRAGVLAAGAVGTYLTKRDGLAQRQEQIQFTVTSNEAPLPIAYGRARLGVKVVDFRVDEDSEDDRRSAYVVAFCVGSENGEGIEGIDNIFFDGRAGIIAPNVTGALSSDGNTKFDEDDNDVLEYSIHLGSDSQTADAELVATFDEWNANGAGRGIAYMAMFLTYDENAWRSGIPQVTAQLQGRKVYDPRSDTWGWSENPALCILDYLTSARVGLGALYAERDGGARSEIDEASFIAAANYCEETVSVPDGLGGSTSQPRFICGGWVDTGRDPASNLRDLLSSCRGRLVYEQGKFRLVINQPAVPTAFELTPDNIIGEWEFFRSGAGQVPNRVAVTYIDSSANFQPNEAIWPEAGQANGFLTNDNGFENTLQLDLPFTNEYYRAQQIGILALREQREDVGCVVSAKESALVLRVGDVVPLTHPTPGYDAQPMRVEAVGINPDGTVRLVLAEHDDGAYSLDPQNTRDTLSGSILPDPFTVEPPADLALLSDSTTALNTQEGQRIPQLLVTWTKSPDPFLDAYRLRYRVEGQADWQTAPPPGKRDTRALITPVTADLTYEVELAAVNTVGRRSVALVDTVVGGTQPGDDVWLGIGLFGLIEETETTHIVGGKPGAGVDTIWAYELLLSQGTKLTPGPAMFAGVDAKITEATDPWEYPLQVPPPGYIRIAMFIPRGVGLETAGPAEFYTLNPNQDRPDKLNALTLKGVHEDGSVDVLVNASSRALSARYASVVGTAPSEPADAAVEAGTVLPLTNGFASFTLPAGTVPRGERIVLKMVGYQNADGTGTDGVTDHSDALVAQWERTKFVAPTLDVTFEDEVGTDGVYRVRLNDPDGQASAIYYRTKEGADPFGAWTLKSGAPSDGVEYEETVPLLELHPSHVQFRVDYTLGGEAGDLVVTSRGFDAGRIPSVLELSPRLDEVARTASAEVTGDFDLAGVKILAQVGSFPSDAAVLAAPTITPASGRNWTATDIGVLVSGLVTGNLVHYKALGIGPGGEQSPTYVTRIAEFRLLQPTLEPGAVSEVGSTGTYEVIVRDAGGQAESLHYRTRTWDGGTPGEWGGWVLKSSSPSDGVAYQESVELQEGHPAQIQFRLSYTLLGQADKIDALSPVFDLGRIPDVVVKAVETANRGVSAVIQGDSDTASAKVAASTSAKPTPTEIRAATAVNGRSISPTAIGDLLTDQPIGTRVYVGAFGYSGADGAGTESSAPQYDELIVGQASNGILSVWLEQETSIIEVTPGPIKLVNIAVYLYWQALSPDVVEIDWSATVDGSPEDSGTIVTGGETSGRELLMASGGFSLYTQGTWEATCTPKDSGDNPGPALTTAGMLVPGKDRIRVKDEDTPNVMVEGEFLAIGEGLTVDSASGQPRGKLSINTLSPIGSVDAANDLVAVYDDSASGHRYATVSQLGGGGGVTDHGALTGLGDDDHPQYAKKAGDTFTGAIVGTTASFSGNVQVNTSDRRLKGGIRPIRLALWKLVRLHGILYRWNELAHEECGCLDHEERVGLLAQDVARVLPQAIHRSPIGGDYLAFYPEMVLPLVVQAVKELAWIVLLLGLGVAASWL